MKNMIGLFGLMLLGTVWTTAATEEAMSPDNDSFPTMEMIESVMRTSFEQASRAHIIDNTRKAATQEASSLRHHFIHGANSNSWGQHCVWKAMSMAARQLPQLVDPFSLQVKARANFDLETVNNMCRRWSHSHCGVGGNHGGNNGDNNGGNNDDGCNPRDPYRTIDGSCNNLQNILWGAASTPFERYLEADYGAAVNGDNGFRTSNQGDQLPEAREISRVLSDSKQRKEPTATLMLVQWGQFIDHDITLTPEREHHEEVDGTKAIECCDTGLLSASDQDKIGNDCRPINVEGDDYYEKDGRECLRFVRSMPATVGCSFASMEQINQITAFVDGSQIYGSDEETAEFIRTYSKGLLKTTDHDGTGAALPPRGGDGQTFACPVADSMNDCFIVGDVRGDEMPGLTATHTAFIRLHNIIAKELYDINPRWRSNDEKIFQETRRIVSAITQQITYRDWLPHVVGQTLMDEYDLNTGTRGYKDTYNQNINPAIRNIFATAAFRFGHSQITDMVKAATDAMNVPLEGNFFNTTVIESDGTGPSSLLKGMSRCPSEAMDGFVAKTFTDKMFAAEPADDGNFYGLDLVSLNIQRGRDHGIPSYREWRKFCGLSDVSSFKKLNKVMEKATVKGLKGIYDHIDDVDVFPAGIAEYPLDDGLLGPTFACIVARQFAQIKHGDRFWYERSGQPKPFTPDQLNAIRSQGLASVLCAVSEHTSYGFQPDPFLVANSPGNAVQDCSNYSFIDLKAWKEKKGKKPGRKPGKRPNKKPGKRPRSSNSFLDTE